MEKGERFKDVNYESLEHAQILERTTVDRFTKRTRLWSFAAGVVTAGLLFLIFILAGRVLPPMPKSHDITESLRLMEQAEWNDCGGTSEIAMSRGCLMEPLIYCWVPPQCLFEELTIQYPVFEDRAWYTNENHTEVVPVEDLWKGKHIHIYTERSVIWTSRSSARPS
jgi:hypothetical protein